MGFSVQVIRRQTKDGVKLYDATGTEKSKSGWLRLFKELDAEGAFEALGKPYEHPLSTEKLATLFAKMGRQLGTTESVVQKQTFHEELNGPKWTWPSAFILNADGFKMRVTVETDAVPISENSKQLAKFAASKKLYEEAKAGVAKAAMTLCLQVPGVTFEGALDPTKEKA